MRALLLSFTKRTRPFVYTLLRPVTASSAPPLSRSLHDDPSSPSPTPPPFSSRILQSDPNPNALPAASPAPESDEAMDEFLSRFVHAFRGKLVAAFPSLPRHVLDEMLLLICQSVVSRLDSGDSSAPAAAAAGVELSEDLWREIWETSASVHEAMRRDRVRAELRNYLHCDEVKEMCRFAGDVGIRGAMLRELRFKWAREKLEEVEFYRRLDRMRHEAAAAESEAAAPVALPAPAPKLTALPERKGKIRYKIYGLDLSGPEWAEVAEKAARAEREFVPEDAKPIEGKSKMVEERLLAVNPRKGDPAPVLVEWADALGQPRRVDWLALLERVKQRSVELYLKVAEILLAEESFEPNVRDYSKLIDLHSKANHIEDAERILNKMTKKGIRSDILTSITLVHMYSKAGNLDRAKEAFESLKKEGFQPDLKVFNSMISAYAKAGDPKQGELLTRQMDSLDIKPTKDIYMELMRAFAECGQVDGAQRIMTTMQFAGIQPNLESYTLLMEAYGRAGDPDQARGHFDQMRKSGHKPDDRCIAGMMSAYMKKNLLDKALDLLLTLEKEGFQLGVKTNVVLADWLGRLQLVQEAERVVSNINKAGEAPFEIHVSLCDMYARARQVEKARKSLQILEGQKKHLQADQFERIVSGLLAGGLIEDAKRIYSTMQSQGFSPSETIRVAFMAAQSIPRPRPSTRRGGKS